MDLDKNKINKITEQSQKISIIFDFLEWLPKAKRVNLVSTGGATTRTLGYNFGKSFSAELNRKVINLITVEISKEVEKEKKNLQNIIKKL